MRLRQQFLFAGLPFLAALSSYASGPSKMVKDWRIPSKQELADRWRDKASDRFARIVGDFDNDGVEDVAQLLVKKDGKTYGLFVWLGANKSAPIKLDQDSINRLSVMGIKKLSSGIYPTACGKGYFDCKKNDGETIEFTANGISSFKDEGAESVFQWLKDKKRFQRVWLSD